MTSDPTRLVEEWMREGGGGRERGKGYGEGRGTKDGQHRTATMGSSSNKSIVHRLLLAFHNNKSTLSINNKIEMGTCRFFLVRVG
jgi:hypothetical protein